VKSFEGLAAECAAVTPPPRDSWADALTEAREIRGLTAQQRYDLLASACAAVFEILDGHPRREEILAFQEPRAADTRAIIERARAPGAT
jgi:hypothetical protein